MTAPRAFYRPENPRYSIVASALDSVRFLLTASRRDPDGGLFCPSVDADVTAQPMRYRGRLMEGVGYCADTIFGVQAMARLARLLDSSLLEVAAYDFLDHALSTGFFASSDPPIRLYRDIESGQFLDNLEARPDYVELGHVARVGTQLLRVARLDPDDDRAQRCLRIAVETGSWIAGVDRCPNGWYPRRCTPDGRIVTYAPDAFGPVDLWKLGRQDGPDPIHDVSGAGSYAIELLAELTADGLADHRETLNADVELVKSEGGFFGSTNTDTESHAENVSYAALFQALLAASRVVGADSSAVVEFAVEHCLKPLRSFELVEDVDGIATKGLLYMEREWNAACMWETAEVAEAYLRAPAEVGSEFPVKALTILRSMALHHHGEFGFLTEATDWDGHSTVDRHFPGESVGDIATTHPFLNNLHVVSPTATYLESFALRVSGELGVDYYDSEGNAIWSDASHAALAAAEQAIP